MSTKISSEQTDIYWRTTYPINHIAPPFPTEKYTVSISLQNGQARQCVNDFNSHITITTSELRLNLCSAGNVFNNDPMRVLGYINATDIGLPAARAADKGDLILLAQTHDSAGALLTSPKLYCAWYKVLNERIYMSIHIGDPWLMKCNIQTGSSDHAVTNEDIALEMIRNL